MTAPRIDTVRNTTNQLIHKTAEALDHLEDLHTLGYYRHADHRARDRVTGGDPTAVGIDLDTHGDPRYRAAYERLATIITNALQELTTAVDDAIAQFTIGTITTRTDRTADATSDEVLAAMASKTRRRARGETGSLAVTDQPLPANARRLLDANKLREELDALQAVVRKAGRADRSRLTPREVTAYENAMGIRPGRRRKGRRP